MMTSTIEIRDLRLQAYHGVLTQERVVGNKYSIDVTLTVDISRAMESDDLNDTVNYAAVVWLIQEEMAKSSQLLEHVAGRIVNHLHQCWDQIQAVDLRIAKLSPPIEADVAQCAVRVRQEFYSSKTSD